MTDTIPRLDSRPGGLNIYYKGKYLYHEQSPEEHTQIRASSIPLPEKSIIIVPSPLLGYGIKQLLQRLPSTSHLLCIEKDQLLMEITLRMFLPQILQDSRISLIRTDSIPALIEFVGEKIDWKQFRKVLLVSLNRGYLLYRSFYDEVQRQLLLHLERVHRNRLTTIRMGKRWMSNLFQNLLHLPKALHMEQFRIRKPPLVVGAGESLEDRFEWIEKIRESVYLMAVDTALPVLGSLGIRPDLAMSVDSQAINLQDFLSLPYEGIPLIADLTVYPGILRNWKGPLYLLLTRFESLRWFEDPLVISMLPTMIPPLGSVGNIALYIACTYSDPALPILCLGMDFHYIPGKPHARGSYTHRVHVFRHHRLDPSPLLEHSLNRQKGTARLLNGQSVRVDPVLQSFQEVARTICQRERRIYTLSTRGLDFGAIPIEDFRQVTSLLGEIRPVAKTIPDEFPLPPPYGNTRKVLQFLQEEYGRLEELEAGIEKKMYPGSTHLFLHKGIYCNLESLDFLFLDLPELPPHETRGTSEGFSTSLAVQLVSNIKYYLRILSQIQRGFNLPRT